MRRLSAWGADARLTTNEGINPLMAAGGNGTEEREWHTRRGHASAKKLSRIPSRPSGCASVPASTSRMRTIVDKPRSIGHA